MKKIYLGILVLLLCGCTNATTSESSISEEPSDYDSSTEEESSSLQEELVSVKYENPVYDHDFADPSYVKCEEDGYYYMFATGPKIIKTKDLVNYELVGNAFSTRPNWGTAGAGVWAPDVQYINGQYIMYYSLSKWDDPNPGIGIATASHPAGPWDDKGKLFLSKEIGVNNSIDPMVFQDDDGKVYMVWGSFRGNYLIELSSDGLSFKTSLEDAKENKVLVAGCSTERPLDVATYEGAYIIKKDGYYYLFLSNGQCCSGAYSYNLRVARSTSITGPYIDKNGANVCGVDKGTTIINASSSFIAVGHNSVVKDDNGDYWTLYHGFKKSFDKESYQETVDYSKRVLLMDKLVFDEDGWPSVFGGIPSSNRKNGPLLYKQVLANI